MKIRMPCVLRDEDLCAPFAKDVDWSVGERQLMNIKPLAQISGLILYSSIHSWRSASYDMRMGLARFHGSEMKWNLRMLRWQGRHKRKGQARA